MTLSDWALSDDDLAFAYARSSGPGGQNVNKVSTKVELRLRLVQTQALTAAQKRRLRQAYPSHVTAAGDFLLVSDRYRSQARNRGDVLERLQQMLETIRHPPKPRVPTKPSRAQKARRREDKRRQSARKQSRKTLDS